MSYPIWIGVSTEGTPLIGAAQLKRHDVASSERVYGSQIPHRVVGYVGGQWLIMTPTQANRSNAQHVCHITGYQFVPEGVTR